MPKRTEYSHGCPSFFQRPMPSRSDTFHSSTRSDPSNYNPLGFRLGVGRVRSTSSCHRQGQRWQPCERLLERVGEVREGLVLVRRKRIWEGGLFESHGEGTGRGPWPIAATGLGWLRRRKAFVAVFDFNVWILFLLKERHRVCNLVGLGWAIGIHKGGVARAERESEWGRGMKLGIERFQTAVWFRNFYNGFFILMGR